MTKSSIARKVADEGITVIIANGKRDQILLDILSTEENGHNRCTGEQAPPYTRFIPASSTTSGIRKWIAHSEGFAKGSICLHPTVSQLLADGNPVSILPVGITSVCGEFEKDDIIRVMDCNGKVIGVGKAACDATQVAKEIGSHGKKPVIHYNYLYIE